MASMVFVGLAVAAHFVPYFAIIFLVVSMLLMGLSRVQAGEHWASDVLGGYLLGTAWLLTTAILYEKASWRARTARATADQHEFVYP